jgi:hypothetical protein
MNEQDAVNGLQHSLIEIDMQLARYSPQMRRHMFMDVVMGEVNELLDQRNVITGMIGELALDDYKDLMEN